ncbi:MAG: hypothetical protein ACE1ZM_05630, partial [Gammaproteobacteria bacterium]
DESTLLPGSSPASGDAMVEDELDDIDLPDPDFDFDITGTAEDSDAVDEDEEDTVLRDHMPAADSSDGSDETILLDDDNGDDVMDGYADDDSTIRPD